MSKAQQTKAGRVPVSSKTSDEVAVSPFDFDYSIFNVDPELKRKIESQGLVCRWINAKNYFSGGNFHKSGWRAYRVDADSSKTNFNAIGANSEGYIVRNDMVLAVKTNAEADRHRANLEMKRNRLTMANKNAASVLRETLGGRGKIYEGYEENGGGESDDE